MFRTYTKMKYLGMIFKCGEFIEIFHLDRPQPYVARLLRIGQPEGVLNPVSKEFIIEVEWYMKKEHLTTHKFKKY